MAAFIFSLFLFAFYSASTSAQGSPPNITLGSSLTPTGNSSWLSPSGLFAFGFYQQANKYAVGIFLAGIPQKTVVWTANRDNPNFLGNVSLLLSRDGRLILQQTQGRDINIVLLSESISLGSMLDSGNFVLYNSEGRTIWQSFDNPTNTLLPGQRLKADQELVSSASEVDDSKGKFRIKMQSDGNLVQYPVNTPDIAEYSYFTSYTNGQGSTVTLNLDDDGYVYLINSTGSILRNITNGGYPGHGKLYLLKIDVDGILRLYSFSLDRGYQTIPWNSTNNECAPKGRCGFNAYCTMLDNKMECVCLPGFDFVSQGNWSSGCERNFTAESCKSKEVSDIYSIVPLENTWWEDNSFFELKADTQEDCINACLEDCNCEVAFFEDSWCAKQRLPLKYGSKRSRTSNIVLIKVGPSSLSGQGNPNNLPKVVKKEVNLDVLIIGISLAVFGVFIIIILGIYVRINHGRGYKELPQNKKVAFLDDVILRAFTFEELEEATNNFSDELDRGAFGTVYKGVLPSSQKAVAVKKLEKVLAEGELEFQNEIRVIGKTHHRNLVKLLGYCLDGMKRFLVYEYMSNGSLADVLFKMENHLCWDDRIRIAGDVARGILYLHDECETQIIHCDVKPQNILMDENRRAKISDFGLAKLLDHDQTRTYTALRGTKGYVAPEWHRRSAVTVKADVYSFGIVLLEIICCRKNVNYGLLTEDEAILEEWAYDCFEAGELYKLVASGEEVDMRKFERMMKIALWCIQNDPSFRPSMKKVLMMMEGNVDIPIPPCPDSFLSAV